MRDQNDTEDERVFYCIVPAQNDNFWGLALLAVYQQLPFFSTQVTDRAA